MKRIYIILAAILLMAGACKKEEIEGGSPLSYDHYFQILDAEGQDAFRDLPAQELKGIQYKGISINKNSVGETAWESPIIIRNDTATIFRMYALHDTTFIRYPHTPRMDTILHKTTHAYDKQGNHLRIKVSEFFFNGERVAVLDFEADRELLLRLHQTNADSLRQDTYVMKFQRDY